MSVISYSLTGSIGQEGQENVCPKVGAVLVLQGRYSFSKIAVADQSVQDVQCLQAS